MRNGTQKHYWLLGLLFLISVIPQVIMLPLLGSINLLFLIAVWVILCTFVFLTAKPIAIACGALAAMAMAIPPSLITYFPRTRECCSYNSSAGATLQTHSTAPYSFSCST